MRRAYSVVQAGEVLGVARLEHADRSMGVVHGPFVPGPGYSAVQELFRRFSRAQGTRAEAKAAAEYYSTRDALGLRLVDADGTVVETGFIHITDLTAQGLDELYVEILIRDESFWEGYAPPAE